VFYKELIEVEFLVHVIVSRARKPGPDAGEIAGCSKLLPYLQWRESGNWHG